MLNLVLINPQNGSLWDGEKPIWELDKIPSAERRKIPVPNNLAELYTLQSRRLFLKTDEQGIIGYSLLGGDFFDKENAFVEPMTVWGKRKEGKNEFFSPRRHDSAKQFWREFSSVFPKSDAEHIRPGILNWADKLKQVRLLQRDLRLNVRIAAVQYGDKDFFVTNVFSDSLSMNGALITDLAKPCQLMIDHSVAVSGQIADTIWSLADNLNRAAGGEQKAYALNAKAQYYHRIDGRFRQWLASLSEEAEIEAAEIEWLASAVKVADQLAGELVAQSGTNAFIGHIHNEHHYSLSEAKIFYDVAMSEHRKKINASKKETEVKNNEQE